LKYHVIFNYALLLYVMCFFVLTGLLFYFQVIEQSWWEAPSSVRARLSSEVPPTYLRYCQWAPEEGVVGRVAPRRVKGLGEEWHHEEEEEEEHREEEEQPHEEEYVPPSPEEASGARRVGGG
jgi:hypothetical protein